MLGKLIKYEFKSTYRTFFTLFGIIFLATLITIAGDFFQSEIISVFGILALTFLAIPVIVVYLYTIVQRYSNNLYGDEGYLMFTLPVKSWQIVLSKLLVALVWAIGIGIVTMVAGLLGLIYVTSVHNISYTATEFFQEVSQLIQLISPQTKLVLVLAMIVTGMTELIKIYFCISLSKIPFIKKGSTAFAVIFYFLYSYVETNIIDKVMEGMGERVYSASNIIESNHIFIQQVSPILIIYIICGAATFAGLMFILSKKLQVK